MPDNILTLDNILMEQLKNPPSTGQFAINGIWENTLSFKAHQPPSIDEIKTYFSDRNELAFELFFGELFFGVRFTGTPAYILELSEHCLKCMSIHSDLASFIKAVADHTLCGKLCHEMDYMEIGAVNAWKSIGSFRLPPLKDEPVDMNELWSEICTTPLAKDSKHPKAIEVAYNKPLHHWLGFPVSYQQQPYSLRKDLFLAIVQHYYKQKNIKRLIINP